MRDIVLVHSNEKLSELYHNRLLKHFRVKTAHDGLKGVRMIRDINPHLVITEYDLPFLSGIGVLRFTRSHLPTIGSPVIFISHRDPDLEALDAGGSEWLKTDEISVEELVNKVYYHLLTNKILR